MPVLAEVVVVEEEARGVEEGAVELALGVHLQHLADVAAHGVLVRAARELGVDVLVDGRGRGLEVGRVLVRELGDAQRADLDVLLVVTMREVAHVVLQLAEGLPVVVVLLRLELDLGEHHLPAAVGVGLGAGLELAVAADLLVVDGLEHCIVEHELILISIDGEAVLQLRAPAQAGSKACPAIP